MSDDSAVAPVKRPKPVDVEAIERELARLWHQPNPNEGTPEDVTRAVMSNLIIYCDDDATAAEMPLAIADIVPQHPCRALLLIATPDHPKDEIIAYVSAHCRVIGGRRQVCSEDITVAAGGSATRRLPSAVRSLLLGDLPTALWWASHKPPPLGGELFEELSLMADQVIYESVSWPDPVRGVLAVAEWATSELNEQVLADLQWRRLKLWRRLISQALAPEVVHDALQTITEVAVEHGPHALPQAWLLVGWLASRLGWKPDRGRVQGGTEIHWGFQSSHGPVRIIIRRLSTGEPEVHSATLRWKTKEGLGYARFMDIGDERLQVIINDGEARALSAPVRSRAGLIAKQLPDRERDAIFLETLQHAGSMAAALA